MGEDYPNAVASARSLSGDACGSVSPQPPEDEHPHDPVAGWQTHIFPTPMHPGTPHAVVPEQLVTVPAWHAPPLHASSEVHASPSSHASPSNWSIGQGPMVSVVGVPFEQLPEELQTRGVRVRTICPRQVPLSRMHVGALSTSSPQAVPLGRVHVSVRSSAQVPPAHIEPTTWVPVHEFAPSARQGRPVMGAPQVIPSRLSRIHGCESGTIAGVHEPVPLQAKVVIVRD